LRTSGLFINVAVFLGSLTQIGSSNITFIYMFAFLLLWQRRIMMKMFSGCCLIFLQYSPDLLLR
jgi:hypothetical protein